MATARGGAAASSGAPGSGAARAAPDDDGGFIRQTTRRGVHLVWVLAIASPQRFAVGRVLYHVNFRRYLEVVFQWYLTDDAGADRSSVGAR